MKINYLNGNRLYYAFLAGGNAVIRDENYLNKINVFPFPDADTGTNLASTMRSIAEGSTAAPSIKQTLMSMANAALSGARGNSGIIFAQYIHGISREISNEAKLSTRSFGESVKRAVQYAYRALVSPVEGTMLTVIREWAEDVYENRMKTHDFAELLSDSLQAARKSLRETTKKLSVLAKAGVVDAGAKGFVDFLEGIVEFIKKGKLKNLYTQEISPVESDVGIHTTQEALAHRYCAEALLSGQDLDIEKIRSILRSFGSSAIVAGSEEKVRIHLHTDRPSELFFKIKDFGSITKIKVDDMKKQYEAAHHRKFKIALVTDSSSDLPQEITDEHQIYVIPFQLSFGPNLFLDRVTISPEQFYELLKTSREHPKTSQPDIKSVENLLTFLASHYTSIIVITLSDRLSGFFSLCQKAAEKVKNKKITVISSKSISATLGLIVNQASEMILAGKSHEEIVRAVEELAVKARILADIQTLKYLVRGGRVSPLKGFVAKLLNLKPVVTLDSEGKALLYGKSFSRKRNMEKILKIIRTYSDKVKIQDYAIVHAQNLSRARIYEEKLTSILQKKPAYVMEISPVIGAHNGIGVVGIALLGQSI